MDQAALPGKFERENPLSRPHYGRIQAGARRGALVDSVEIHLIAKGGHCVQHRRGEHGDQAGAGGGGHTGLAIAARGLDRVQGNVGPNKDRVRARRHKSWGGIKGIDADPIEGGAAGISGDIGV